MNPIPSLRSSVAVAAMALILAACGGGGSDAASTASTGGSASSGSTSGESSSTNSGAATKGSSTITIDNTDSTTNGTAGGSTTSGTVSGATTGSGTDASSGTSTGSTSGTTTGSSTGTGSSGSTLAVGAFVAACPITKGIQGTPSCLVGTYVGRADAGGPCTLTFAANGDVTLADATRTFKVNMADHGLITNDGTYFYVVTDSTWSSQTFIEGEDRATALDATHPALLEFMGQGYTVEEPDVYHSPMLCSFG